MAATFAVVALSGCRFDGCSEADAYEAIKAEVAPNLTSPGSARFQPASEALSGGGETCSFIYQGYVDSQNQFGALLRSNWVGTVAKNHAGKYMASVFESNFRFLDN